jgi:hypothetical protein
MNFTDLSALQKFIRRGYGLHAARVAKILPEALALSRLNIIAFEDIGIANVPLLKSILPITAIKTATVVKMATSYKSRLCSYLSYQMREVFVNMFEPFPEQQEIFAYLNKDNLHGAIRTAGAMYWKGMDVSFWDLIRGDLPDSEKAFADVLQQMAADINDRAAPMVWIFAVLWKLGIQNEVPWSSQYTTDISSELTLKSRKDYPAWVFDKHTSQGKAAGQSFEQFWKEGIKVNSLQTIPLVFGLQEDVESLAALNYKLQNKEPIKLSRSKTFCASSDYFYVELASNPTDPKVVRYHEIGEPTIPAQYSFKDLGSKNKVSLKDLGTLQIPMTNTIGRRPFVIYCWLTSSDSDKTPQRYVLKPYNTKQNAILAAQSDIEMAKNIYQYPWCYESRVICLSEEIKKGATAQDLKIEDGRTYYTISAALPYFLPTTVALQDWKSHTDIASQVILINIMKYIYGIADRTARNTGIYITADRQVRVCSFDHGPILAEQKGPLFGKLGTKLDTSSLTKERAWLGTIKVDKKYYTRLSEVLTSLDSS